MIGLIDVAKDEEFQRKAVKALSADPTEAVLCPAVLVPIGCRNLVSVEK